MLLDSEGLTTLGDCLVQTALVSQGDTEVDVGLHVVLLNSDGLAELGDGSVVVTLVIAEDCTQTVVDFGEVLLEPDGVDLGEVLLESNGLAVLSDGLVQLTLGS